MYPFVSPAIQVFRWSDDPDETLSKLTVILFLLMKKIKGGNKRTVRRNVVITTCFL